MEPELVWLGPEDAEGISELARDLFFDVYSYESRELVEGFLEEHQSPDAIRDQMSEGMRYAHIVVDGEVVGYTAFGPSGNDLELSKLYILDGHRGQGIGGAVLGMVERRARETGAGRILLEVNSRNDGAVSLYRRHGFVPTGEVRYHRMVMAKRLRRQDPSN